ncbi:MAG: ribonuclease J [Candidatus Gracilibacteria bacterium]|nr:ribonuclease J [Candidatus Gracilibacteria bacterium]
MNKLTDWFKKPESQNGASKKEATTKTPASSPQQKKTHHKTPQHHHKKRTHQKSHTGGSRKAQHQSQKTHRFKGNKLLKIMPMAGLDEVGKNMNAIEFGDEIVTIDCGLQFPEPGMLGIDYVIPDTTYLEQNKKKVKAMLITHGHLDHIGALKHILPKLGFPPVYGSALTIGMIQKQLDEFKLTKRCDLRVVENGKPFKIGSYEVEYFLQNHSIPDSNGIVLRTPVGNIVHTGDWKFDFTPASGECADFQHLAKIGSEGVLALMGESTNAPIPGYTMSEKKVAEVLENIIEKAKGRVIIASFSSLMGRINQILHIAHKNDRKVFVSGRSMMNNIEIGTKTGFIKPPSGTLREIRQMGKHPSHKTIILCTGSQGEGLAALSRVAIGEHRDIKLTPSDTIVLSSNAIIGNEKSVVSMINKLLRHGVKVITNKHMDVHTSGHAKQEEIKLMLKLMTPKYLIPVHGEYLLRHAHKNLALEIGMEDKKVIMAENGDIIETDGHTMRKSKSKIPANNIFIDGHREGEGHLSKVMLDRQIMSENGVAIIAFRVNQDTGKLIANPAIDSRGLIYLKDSPEIYSKCVEAAKKAYEKGHARKASSDEIKLDIKRSVGKVIMNMVKRNPIIMPFIVKV